jgi:beta-hydroxylase
LRERRGLGLGALGDGVGGASLASATTASWTRERMMPTVSTGTAFKILTADEWSEWQETGWFTGSSADKRDGFIHLSSREQVPMTLERHFAGQQNLILAEIDLHALGTAIKWEVSRGGQVFPHSYGPIPRSAVLSHQDQESFNAHANAR